MRSWRLTRAEAADALGLSRSSLDGWANRSGAPIALEHGRKVFLWPSFPRWREEELERAIRDAHHRAKGSQSGRSRWYEARATREELRLARDRGELCTVAAVVEAQGAIDMRTRAQLLALPTRLAPQCVGLRTIPEAVAILEAGVQDVLAELRGPNDDDEPPADDPPEGDNRLRSLPQPSTGV